MFLPNPGISQDGLPSLREIVNASHISGGYSTGINKVIFMVGDGMGLTQITAGMYANNRRLNLERCRVIGLHKPYSGSHLVTDSAAGATAFSCGIKTYNYAVGVDMDTIPCKTILEEAIERGFATGIVATSTIVHATPASFYAHNFYRKNYEDIAEELVNSNIDYIVGGGLKYFRNRTKDDRDLTAEMDSIGYNISNYFLEDFEQIKPDKSAPFAFITSHDDPLPAASGRDYLLKATLDGLEYLNNKSESGFFFLVEGSQIDWGGHSNNGEFIISEMIDFDNTIGAVLRFADRNPGTLVIITADHEAGGCAIQPESSWDKMQFKFTTDGHTGTMVPVFAYGAGADLFAGIYENTAIYHKIKALLGW